MGADSSNVPAPKMEGDEGQAIGRVFGNQHFYNDRLTDIIYLSTC